MSPKLHKWLFTAITCVGLLTPLLTTTAQTNPTNTYLPYVQCINYVYSGDHYHRRVIIEFFPDEEQIFQVAITENGQTTAYVYQIRPTGLYELDHIENYTTSTDLRQNAKSKGRESLEFATNLEVGSTYYSGYRHEIKNTVLEKGITYQINDTNYPNTVKVVREFPDGKQYYYFTEIYGLIAVEAVDGTPLFTLEKAGSPLQ